MEERNGSMKLVRLLLAHGANVNIENQKKETPFHKACCLAYEKLAWVLIESGALVINPHHNQILTLLIACQNNMKSIVKYMIRRGIDVNTIAHENHSSFFKGETALHCAITLGHISIIKTLLKNRANVNACDFQLHTPFCRLLQYFPNFQIAQMLINYGADLNIIDSSGQSLLCIAIKYNCDKELIELMNESGAKITSEDVTIHGVLFSVCSIGFYSLVQQCIHMGANLNLVNGFGMSALCIAASCGGYFEKVLDNKNESPYQENYMRIIRLLVDNGANVNLKCVTETSKDQIVSKTALYYATISNNSKIVKLLLDLGASREMDELLTQNIEKSAHQNIKQLLRLYLPYPVFYPYKICNIIKNNNLTDIIFCTK